MSWTADEDRAVTRALIGSWPSQVASWGGDAIAAYLEELQARGVAADAALVAIRACPAGQKFPPSAPELAALARRDPDRPTFDELLAELYGPGGLYGFRRSGVTLSPWTLKFAEDRAWLRELPVESEDAVRKASALKRLRESYEAFCDATDGREVHEIASRSGRGTLGRIDPLATLGLKRPAQIGRGE